MKFRYTLIEERWNAYTHIVGAVGSGVVCLIFLIQTIQHGNALDILSIALLLLGVVSSYVFFCYVPRATCPLALERKIAQV